MLGTCAGLAVKRVSATLDSRPHTINNLTSKIIEVG